MEATITKDQQIKEYSFALNIETFMKISAIIPTKNRREDLIKAVRSIIEQKRTPEQLIIVDQSSESCENALRERLNFPEEMTLTYVYDTTITGLVEAKSKSLDHVTGDLVCFFEDDIILEPDYLEQIEKVFLNHPKAIGCSGIITNATSSGRLYRWFYRITHIGIFRDPRPQIYARLATEPSTMITSNVINGGLSAWRKSVFDTFKFDLINRFHMMEDFEFSTRVSAQFPGSLFITSAARLEHHYSPLNREGRIKSVERKVWEYLLFYKKNSSSPGSGIALAILMTGLFLDAAIKSIIQLKIAYLNYYFRGIKKSIS
jgi:GT2 family glycosyltransferase